MKLLKFATAGILAALFSSAALSETKTYKDYSITLKTSRDSAVYKRGEKAEFTLDVSRAGKPVDGVKFSGEISKDSVPPRRAVSGETSNGGKFSTFATLDEAGFLKCRIFVEIPEEGGKTKKLEMLAGAGFDPLEIKPSLPAPKDFDAFWLAQKKILKAIPLNLQKKEVKAPDGIVAYDVCADSFDGKLRGYLAMPKNTGKKSLPAIILPHGAGVYSARLPLAIEWAKRGFIAFDFNVHGILNGQPVKYYKDLERGELKGYPVSKCDSRETIYFRKVFMLVMRALDTVMSMPEWDGKNLVSLGGSQAGGQSLAAAALYPDKVSLICAQYPAICDHSGIVAGRTTGWPHFVKERDANGNFDRNKMEAARYVDAVNFAARIKCPVIYTIHLADNVCEPTSCYAAYNNIKSPKKLLVSPEIRHYPPPQWEREQTVALVMKAVKGNSKK